MMESPADEYLVVLKLSLRQETRLNAAHVMKNVQNEFVYRLGYCQIVVGHRLNIYFVSYFLDFLIQN